ncbi:MAG: hypothetical protein ABI315_00355 [Bacteroidia bacterium]
MLIFRNICCIPKIYWKINWLFQGKKILIINNLNNLKISKYEENRVLGATTTVSCKKEYNCKCEKTYVGISGSIIKDEGEYQYKDTKANAAKSCNEREGTDSEILGSWTRNCEIK